MDKRIWIAALAGGVVAFFLGWLIWGILLMDFMESHTTVYDGLYKEKMNLLAMFVSCLLFAFLLSWVYSRFEGRKSLTGGAVAGAVIALLVSAGLDLNFLANWNLYTPFSLVVDVIANGVYGAVIGGVVGWVFRDKE